VNTLTVSARYRVVIPRAMRKALGIRAGERVQVIELRGRIQIRPMKSIPERRISRA